jgi:antitoxin (DNA-binding transcriptional repressor) of toxin-antitoxin stability system
MPEMTDTITATHLRENLGAVLDAVLAGRTVNVLRNGRPLCTLIPPSTAPTVGGAGSDQHEPPTKGNEI